MKRYYKAAAALLPLPASLLMSATAFGTTIHEGVCNPTPSVYQSIAAQYGQGIVYVYDIGGNTVCEYDVYQVNSIYNANVGYLTPPTTIINSFNDYHGRVVANGGSEAFTQTMNNPAPGVGIPDVLNPGGTGWLTLSNAVENDPSSHITSDSQFTGYQDTIIVLYGALGQLSVVYDKVTGKYKYAPGSAIDGEGHHIPDSRSSVGGASYTFGNQGDLDQFLQDLRNFGVTVPTPTPTVGAPITIDCQPNGQVCT